MKTRSVGQLVALMGGGELLPEFRLGRFGIVQELLHFVFHGDFTLSQRLPRLGKLGLVARHLLFAVSEIILLIFGIIQRKYASDVYIREQNLDDIGRIGIREFAKTASPAGHRPHSIFRKAGKTVWKFSVPLSVRLRGWWKTLLGLIAGAALCTGLGVFDRAAEVAGAGTLVSITGFANAVAAPAMEFRSEGWIAGTAVKMFTIAGPVIVYGLTASVVYGIVLAVLG